jgi:hypothetical protein
LLDALGRATSASVSSPIRGRGGRPVRGIRIVELADAGRSGAFDAIILSD